MTEQTPSRIQDFMNDQVLLFAQQAQAEYQSDDLVVILDITEENPELVAVPRVEMATSEDLSENLRSTISRPASATRKKLNSPHLSFWFILIHEDGIDCASFNAAILGPSGSA